MLPFHLNKLKSSSPRDAFYQVWLKLAQWFYRRRFLNFHYFVIISPWIRAGTFIWINFIQGCFVLSKVEIGRLVLEEGDFSNSSMYFSLFRYYLPLERDSALQSKKKMNSLHPRMIFANFGWNWLRGSGEEDFKNSWLCFRYFGIISPWKRTGPFIRTKMNPFYPRIVCAKCGWNWPSGSG